MKICFLLIIMLLMLGSVSCSQLEPVNDEPETSPSPTLTVQARPQATLTPAATQSIPRGTVVIWHSWDEIQLAALISLITQFQGIYPEIQFEVQYIPPEEFFTRLETSLQQGLGPTLWFGPARWGPPLFDQQLLFDLRSLASQELLESLNPAALESARYAGGLVGLPYTINGIVLFRNSALLPDAPATLDDLLTIGDSLTQEGKIGVYLDRSFIPSGGILEGIDGDLMQEDGTPAFNTIKGVEWIELLRLFSEAGEMGFQTEEDSELFQAGEVGLIIDNTLNLSQATQAIGAENLAIDPWPIYQDHRLSGFVQADQVYLNPHPSEETRQIAWLFVDYFLSPESQAVLGVVNMIPANLRAPLVDPLQMQVVDALSGGVAYPAITEMDIYPPHMDIALQSVFEQGVVPSTALATAEAEILAILNLPTATSTPQP